MSIKKTEWRWEDGIVDDGLEHIELRYGDVNKTSYEMWLLIARIGRPKLKCFPLQWLIKVDNDENQIVIANTMRELDFYLVEKREPNPWAYAQYHCNTAANMYSNIHWSYFPNGRGGKRLSSTVIQFSVEEATKLLDK